MKLIPALMMASLLCGCGQPSQPLPKLDSQERALITDWERAGDLLIEATQHRAYVSPLMWQSIDAKKKDTLVRLLAIDGAERRQHNLMNIDVLDKQSGKQIASFSVWSGVKLE